MSSTKKTKIMRLNQWLTTDIPQMVDFNTDNAHIEESFCAHVSDEHAHTSKQEKKKWDAPCFCGSYMGNGASERTVETECGFDVSFGLVFAASMPPSAVDFNNKIKHGFFGFFCKTGGNSGVSVSGENFTVANNTSSSNGEYLSLNQAGIIYNYVLFR